jgi:gamma-glutamylcyclotransferase (GGCT)/AIG2-like uncharacterized protein YtfP
MSRENIFVYGTLRQELDSPLAQALREQGDYISPARLRAMLYEVDGYPGAILSNNAYDAVQGEVYAIPASLLPTLDQYEECSQDFPEPHEYVREQHEVELHNGEIIRAWVYIFNRDTAGLFQIKSGDYLTYLNSTLR